MRITGLLALLLMISVNGRAQGPATGSGNTGELKMTFPGVYFKHNSTDYAKMPYTADSCFKYIGQRINYVYSFIIWQDSSETDALTKKRIKKLKASLNKYTPAGKIEIQSMGKEQKISRQTINSGVTDEERQYLLSLNSVFDISTSRLSMKKKKNHIEQPRIWCLSCWTSGFHIKARRNLRQMAKKQAQPPKG